MAAAMKLTLSLSGTLTLCSLALLHPTPGSAQTGVDLMDVDILFVGAHPDDDTGVLATFARYILDEGFRGTVVTVTGGEGGGNAIGPEAGRSLGLIRKEEERRALALVGVDSPSFLGLSDFYFTLSADETESKWGKSFVCDVVRYVRLERPEVIVTMWPGPGTHGQHQMAARAATIAFEKASDPDFCPELAADEFLRPYRPLKLYYAGQDGPTTVTIPTDEYSHARYRPYAELKALATSMYRSQGFDRGARIPVEKPNPEKFLLVRSRVPVAQPERSLLEGARLPAGSSPAGIGLRIEPETFTARFGLPLSVNVTFENGTRAPVENLELSLEVPSGWSLDSSPVGTGLEKVEPGAAEEAVFHVVPGTGVRVDENQRLTVAYRASTEGHAIEGANFTWVQASAPVSARFLPLYDVAGYRAFAKETRTEWVIENLPTRLPLVIGRENAFEVEVSNASERRARGKLALELPPGTALEGTTDFDVPARGEVRVPVRLFVNDEVLPEGRHAAKVPLSVKTTVEGLTSEDRADLYALPFLAIPRVAAAPVIDGDLGDMEGFARGEISPDDLWWRVRPNGADDASALFYLAYDASNLYAGVRVRDDAVVCNIAPDDVRAQLRSDAVSITVDPSGKSHDTSTVIQAAAFPCTTEGFRARGFRDADANQGLMEETAPGMQVASKRTEDGYTLELAIPWSAMPQTPKPGDEIGLNVIVYDGDDKNARVGANISESGLGWAAFPWGGKQALPYLWPRVLLKR
jgi:LmbE family N-acetylglucosaminyl deacetylase